MISLKNLPEDFMRFHGKTTYFHICPLSVMPKVMKDGLRCSMGVGRGRNRVFLGDTIAACCDLVSGNATTYYAAQSVKRRIAQTKSPIVREQYTKLLRPIYKAAAILAVDMHEMEWELSPCGVPNIMQTVRKTFGEYCETREQDLTEYISQEDISPERISLYKVVQFVSQVWEMELEVGWSYESDITIPDECTIILE